MEFSLDGYGPMLMSGTVTTLSLAFASLALATMLGLLGASARLSSSKGYNFIGRAYITFIRGIPDLVLMLLFFFGGQLAVNYFAESLGYEEYIDVNPWIAGVLTIGLIFGAYMTETFRGSFLAISPGQLEAATSVGMSGWDVMWRIKLPLMVRFALPGYANNWLVLVKSTALVSIIGLDDVVRKASLAAGASHKPFTFWIFVAGIYLVITSISVMIQKKLDAKFSKGVRRG